MSFACGKSGSATEAQKQGKIQIEFLCFCGNILIPEGNKVYLFCLSQTLWLNSILFSILNNSSC